eukprot:TRINITY_DN1311_c0_g3_i2.p1 TRINITY_DN1311_c0_g3~~TRINITY_DN1311_c0_g3_i2.p1  ORF type:complete len:115 (+),score=13.03 TRINITY_DN1311_c0_g3_i2:37-345(+)
MRTPQVNLHPGVTCDGCNTPIVSIRYKCLQCPNFDFCGHCEENQYIRERHYGGRHFFAKIRSSQAAGGNQHINNILKLAAGTPFTSTATQPFSFPREEIRFD